MGFLSWLLAKNTPADNREREHGGQVAARKLDGAMPISAAGAQLSGKDNESETEEALKRASRDHGGSQKSREK